MRDFPCERAVHLAYNGHPVGHLVEAWRIVERRRPAGSLSMTRHKARDSLITRSHALRCVLPTKRGLASRVGTEPYFSPAGATEVRPGLQPWEHDRAPRPG